MCSLTSLSSEAIGLIKEKNKIEIDGEFLKVSWHGIWFGLVW